MRSDLLITVLAALALATPAAARGRAAERTAEAERVAALPAIGEPRRCLIVRNIQESRMIDANTLLVRENASRWHRVSLPQPCTPFADNRIIVWRSPQGQACAGDPFEVIDPVSRINYGACVLGAFQQVDNGPLHAR